MEYCNRSFCRQQQFGIIFNMIKDPSGLALNFHNSEQLERLKKDIYKLQSNLQKDPIVQKMKKSQQISQHSRQTNKTDDNKEGSQGQPKQLISQGSYSNRGKSAVDRSLQLQIQRQESLYRGLMQERSERAVQDRTSRVENAESCSGICQQIDKLKSNNLSMQFELQGCYKQISSLKQKQTVAPYPKPGEYPPLSQSGLSEYDQEIQMLRAENDGLTDKLSQAIRLMERYENTINRYEEGMLDGSLVRENNELWGKIQRYETELENIVVQVHNMDRNNSDKKGNQTHRLPETDLTGKKNPFGDMSNLSEEFSQSIYVLHDNMKIFQARVPEQEQAKMEVIEVRRSALSLEMVSKRLIDGFQKAIRDGIYFQEKYNQLFERHRVSLGQQQESINVYCKKIDGYDRLVKKLSKELQQGQGYGLYNDHRTLYGKAVLSDRENQFSRRDNGNVNGNEGVGSIVRELEACKMKHVIELSEIKAELYKGKVSKDQLEHYKEKCKSLQSKAFELEKSNLELRLIPVSKKNEEALRKELLDKTTTILNLESEIRQLTENKEDEPVAYRKADVQNSSESHSQHICSSEIVVLSNNHAIL